MSGSRHSCATRLQAVFCSLLVLNLHWIAGCGQEAIAPSAAGTYQIVLTESHPLTEAIRGSAFQGALRLDVYPQTQSFRFIYPDEQRQISGAYGFVEGEFTIKQFSFRVGAKSATLVFETDRRVMSITDSEGRAWTRPITDFIEVDTASAIQMENPYMQANRDLIEVATYIERQGGNTTATGIGSPGGTGGGSSTGGSTSTSPGAGFKNGNLEIIDGIGIILTAIALIWAPLAGIIGPLVTIFTVATVLENALVLRFDGNWRATNANSNMRVTISGGKISRLIDESSQQEFQIAESRVRDISGNRVTWVVLATVLGQSTEVEFTFDVQELADGTLQGTLTALSNTFARVAVTMTRM